MVLRVEDLNASFQEAMALFLDDYYVTKMKCANIGENKEYANNYNEIKENIIIPLSICNKIYNSKYVKHFYSDEIIMKFKNKWSRIDNIFH